MYNNILVATDLSPRACNALKHAVKLAHLFNSKITLINVHEEFMDKKELVMSRVSVENIQESYKQTSLKAKNEINHLLDSVNGEDVQKEIILREGKASEEILEFSSILKPDLIIMGSNGKDSISDYILGTTTSKIVDKSLFPVLVIPDIINE